MKGFFDRTDVVVDAMTLASVAVAQRAPTEALVPPSEPIFAKESIQAKRVVTPVEAPTEIPTP